MPRGWARTFPLGLRITIESGDGSQTHHFDGMLSFSCKGMFFYTNGQIIRYFYLSIGQIIGFLYRNIFYIFHLALMYNNIGLYYYNEQYVETLQKN